MREEYLDGSAVHGLGIGDLHSGSPAPALGVLIGALVSVPLWALILWFVF